MILKSPPESFELDPMPTTLLFECIDEIVPVVTGAVNDSFFSCTFPSVFKTAVIKSLLKKPSLNHDDLNNYRPVSNLTFISKVSEKLVLLQLSEYLHAKSTVQPSSVCLSSKPQYRDSPSQNRKRPLACSRRRESVCFRCVGSFCRI